jgi:pyruvate/2-oxoglutarate dehydrogenase complex dihydrolipoamide acyltransferase (E2) component
LTQVKGSGENGRIVKKGHRKFHPAAPTSAAPAAAAKQLLLLHPTQSICSCWRSIYRRD